MRGRIRIAAVGLVVMTVLAALTSTAGAATVTQWNVTGNGGFVSLDVLNALQLAGGGSEADASSAPVSEAEGTGLCADTSVTTNPCPTNATSNTSGNSLNSTQDAVAKGTGVTATPTGASGCTIPLNTGVINVDVSCGTASASEDATGNPTASGTGSLANVSVSLSLTSFLQDFGGVANLGSVSGICSGVQAASTSGGASTSGLDGTLTTLIQTVNSALGTLSLPGLNSGSVNTGTDSLGACSLIGGLLDTVAGGSSGTGVSVLSGILNQLLGLAGGNATAIAPLTIDVGGSTTSVTSNGNVVTDSTEQHAVDINLFGLADLQVAPTTAAVSLDRSTGVVTPSCNAGVLSYSTMGGLQQFLNLTALTGPLNNLLGQLSGSLDNLLAPLQSLIGDLINYQTPGNLLNCNVTSPGSTASANVGVLNVGLLTGLMGGIGVNVGDVSVSGSATTATPATAATTAAVTPAAPAAAPATAPAVVPNVTSVHTGEFWSGSLPIILLAGMGLAGVMLIGRRRILSVARSINPITRRRGSQ